MAIGPIWDDKKPLVPNNSRVRVIQDNEKQRATQGSLKREEVNFSDKVKLTPGADKTKTIWETIKGWFGF